MIVVCTGCSAKFKVADEKVGPKGAKLRCSKCHTVFMVRREEGYAPPPPEAAEAAPPEPAPSARPVPPPLPKRPAALERPPVAAPSFPSPREGAQGPVRAAARSPFEIDLEPAASPARASVMLSPFATMPQPEDPFAAALAGPAPDPPPEPPASAPAPMDPFGVPGPVSEDPFAAVQAPIPPELLRGAPPAAESAPETPPTPTPSGPIFQADDPFAAALPSLAAAGPSVDGGLALEERSTPHPRPIRSPPSQAHDDPFGAATGEPLPGRLEAGRPGDIPPLSHDYPGEPFGGPIAPVASPGEPAPVPRPEAPLREDPFAAAAVDADPLQVAVAGPVPTAPAEPPEETSRAPVRAAQLRAAVVSAVSLAVLLLMTLALLVVWRGGVPLSKAFRLSSLGALVGHRDRLAGEFDPQQVTSGLYERQRGTPLLFVRGVVVSHAPAPVAAVRVAVEVLRDGKVLARGEGRAGAVLTAEELHGAADAATLTRLADAAAGRAPAVVRPGDPVPFLVAIIDAPADLAEASLRVTAQAEAPR